MHNIGTVIGKGEVINSGYFPISSFLTGYQSDNDNIGTISTETRNPMLQNQTLVQWFIASQGLNSPINISTSQGGPTVAKANTPYYSTYAPQGGYLIWSGDAGIIVGNGIEINNNGGPGGGSTQQNPNNEFYIAFTVQLSNGTWITIVDPNGFSGDVATENGQQSSGLTLAVGSFGSSQTNSQISLYLNGTLVSQANIPKGLHLYYDSACVQGNVVSGTQGPPGKQNPNNPIVIETTGGSTTPQANLAYYSSTEPTGDQIATSDNGKIILLEGNSIQIQTSGQYPAQPTNPQPSSNYYIALSVQLYNGTWITIVDPNPINPTSSTEAIGKFLGSQNNAQMSLYLNNQLVSHVTLNEKDILCYPFMDVGSVYNISNNEIKTIPGMSGDINDAGANSYSFNGALGPGFLYNITLVQTQVQSIQSGTLPSPKDIVVLWSENTAQCVNLNVPGNPGTLCRDAVEVVNLANPNDLNGYWGQGAAIPTAFAPFNDIVIWSGPAPLVFNPSVLAGKNINITFESQGMLIPKNPGTYVFSVNFTDNVGQILRYANEYVTVYMNGQKVFQGSYVNNHLNILYSNIPNDVNYPIFEYHLVKDINITTVFTFNLADASSSTTAPGPGPGHTNSGITAIYFGLMWTPPGQSGFQYISINNFQPFPTY
ncbi:hypothetical protein [Sulfuracidifex metallicus]|uniref:hypothetical protein n=1 Tax=Sulfuracidifex metallicus TaxID=47303 RepID=UPI0006D1A896|nr:hypothetical protein [Sulfuracidifex metallicus]